MNIELDNVSKNFKNQTVLENVNLKLESGKIYGLVGRNGSGKSVLLKIMTGLMEPSDGIIKYGGIPLKKGQYAKDVGIVLDCIGFMPEYTAKENLLLLAKINKRIGEERISEILKQVGLEPDSKKVYRKFSLGMKQKLAIAQAFMEEPKVLLLDEPMNALDEQSVQDMRIMFREYVNKKPAIMVITSHHKEDIEILCDQVYSIKNGYVIDHIKAGQAMKIYEYLKLGDLDCSVAIIKNAKSNKMGKKDIIKIDEKINIDFNVLGYIDHNITINIIENNKKIKKFHPDLEEELINIVKCKNPRCITSIERGLKQICVLKDKENAIYRCKYCDAEV